MNIPQPLADSVGRPTPLDLPLLAAGSPARSESGSEPFESLLRPPTTVAPLPQVAAPKPAPPPEPAASQPPTHDTESAADSAGDAPSYDDCPACPTPEAEAAAAEDTKAEDSTAEEDDVESSEEEVSEVTVTAEAAAAMAVLGVLPVPALPVKPEAMKPQTDNPEAEKPEPVNLDLAVEKPVRLHPKTKQAPAEFEPVVPLQPKLDANAPAKTQPVAEVVETEVETVTEPLQLVERGPEASIAIDAPQPVAPPIPVPIVSASVEPAASREPQPVAKTEDLTATTPNDTQPAPTTTASLGAERPATLHEAEPFSIEQIQTVRPVNEEAANEESESNTQHEEPPAALAEPPPAEVPLPANSPNGSSANPSAAPVSPPSSRLPAELLGGAPGVRSSETTAAQVDSARLLHRVARAFAAAQNGNGEVRLRLSPPELGAIRLEIRVQDGAVIARMQTETSAARTAILDNLPALRERLSEQGVRIDRFDVELMQRQSGGPADQSGNRQPHDLLPLPRPAAAEVRRPQPAEGVVARRPLVADADSRRLNVIV